MRFMLRSFLQPGLLAYILTLIPVKRFHNCMDTSKTTTMNIFAAPGWNITNTQLFWSKIAASNHLVQIYEQDDILLNTLEGFVSGGLQSGDSVIIVASKDHMEALASRMGNRDFDLLKLYRDKRFILLDAEETLSRFMVVGWPDEEKFNAVAKELVQQARGTTNRKIRVFGEMMAGLWMRGYTGATIRLENLWNSFCSHEALCMLCAYPKKGFTQDVHRSIGHICSTHSHEISGEHCCQGEVYFRNV
jgi:hypothetical protein